MIRNIESSVAEPEEIGEQESPGDKAEAIVVEFLREAFPSLITDIQETSKFDQNDKNGVDCVCVVTDKATHETYKFVMDITFDGDERLQEKMVRTVRNPLAQLRDDEGRKIGGPLPRILFRGRSSMDFWFGYEERAEQEGVDIVSTMSDDDRTMKQKEFVEEIFLKQAQSLSQGNKEYARKIRPIKELFEKEREKLEAA